MVANFTLPIFQWCIVLWWMQIPSCIYFVLLTHVCKIIIIKIIKNSYIFSAVAISPYTFSGRSKFYPYTFFWSVVILHCTCPLFSHGHKINIYPTHFPMVNFGDHLVHFPMAQIPPSTFSWLQTPPPPPHPCMQVFYFSLQILNPACAKSPDQSQRKDY